MREEASAATVSLLSWGRERLGDSYVLEDDDGAKRVRSSR